MKKLLLLFIIVFCINIFASPMTENTSDVMLQGFHWNSHFSPCWWKVIEDKAGDISNAGFDMVWFPPSSSSAAVEGYLPNRLYILDSGYGNSRELTDAIRALHNKGVRVIGDIVINHRVGTKDWADFTDPVWGADSVCSNDEWFGAKGSYDTGAGYHAARDIDHTRSYVRDSIVNWMNMLKGVGYDGWRYDFVKGFNGRFVDYYNSKTDPYFSVGEYWVDLDVYDPDGNRQQICDWLDSTGGNSYAFDFTTKGLLQHAINNSEYFRLKDYRNRPAGLIGWWPERSATFIDNHDTGPSTGGNGGHNHWPFPGDKILVGYAYILTHPGIPCVYWPHYFDWGNDNRQAIKKLISIRKSFGITSGSKVNVLLADNSKYVANITGNNGQLIVKIGPGNYTPGASDWKLLTSGNDYALWGKK